MFNIAGGFPGLEDGKRLPTRGTLRVDTCPRIPGLMSDPVCGTTDVDLYTPLLDEVRMIEIRETDNLCYMLSDFLKGGGVYPIYRE